MEQGKRTAIILAGGSGSRMNSDIPKQYMQLKGKPLIWYALHAAEESVMIDDIVLVTGAEDMAYARKEIIEKYGFHKVSAVVAGGAERYDSVYHALQTLADGPDGYVFIHDGARPFLTEEILERCYEAVQKYDACVAGMPVKDTVKVADDDGFAVNTPDRNYIWQIQTPQVFRTSLIVEAYRKLYEEKGKLCAGGSAFAVTDDAMVAEKMLHHPVKLVQGSYENIKITTPEDMKTAEAFMEMPVS